jgi:hypothetical protein
VVAGGQVRATGAVLAAVGGAATACAGVVLVLGVLGLVLASQPPRVLAPSFGPGEEVVVPEGAHRPLAHLVVYGQDVELPGRALTAGCTATGAVGLPRTTGLPVGLADRTTPEGTQVALDEIDGWRDGDRIRCDGDAAAALAPLSLVVVSRGPTAAVVVLVLGLVLLVAGVAVLVPGTVLLRRTRRGP